MNKKIGLIILLATISFIAMLVSSVNSFGYSSSYNADNPLIVHPGETKNVQIGLIVNPDEGELVLKAEMLDNAGIAELSDKSLEYEVSQKKEAVVNIILKIPENASLGREYSIRMRFSDITPSEGGGTVGFKGGMIVTLNPRIAEKPAEPLEGVAIIWISLGIAAIIILIVVIYFIIKRRK